MFKIQCNMIISVLSLSFMRQREKSLLAAIGCTLKEGQALRLLLNLIFYHFNHPEPTYKSKHIMPLK